MDVVATVNAEPILPSSKDASSKRGKIVATIRVNNKPYRNDGDDDDVGVGVDEGVRIGKTPSGDPTATRPSTTSTVTGTTTTCTTTTKNALSNNNNNNNNNSSTTRQQPLDNRNSLRQYRRNIAVAVLFYFWIPILSFVAGVVTPPVRFYLRWTMDKPILLANPSTTTTITTTARSAGTVPRTKMETAGESMTEGMDIIMEERILNDQSTDPTAATSNMAPRQQPHSCTLNSEVLAGFLANHPVPGQHVLCFSLVENHLSIYRNSQWDEKKSLSPWHVGGHDVDWWTSFQTHLQAALSLSTRRYRGQPWAIFDKHGERIVDETYIPSDNGPTNDDSKFDNEHLSSSTMLLQKMQESGVLILFEGGQWIWPGIAKGFERQVLLDYWTPSHQNSWKHQERNVTLVTLSLHPLVLSVHGFLSEDECQYIQTIASPSMQYSSVTLMDHDQGRPASDFRTSQTAFLSSRGNPDLDGLEEIDARTASLVRIPRSHQEYVQVLRYGHLEKYDAHHDYFDPSLYQNDFNTLRLIEHGNKNRLATVFWYLSHVPAGGETIFPRVDRGPMPRSMRDCSRGLKVKPERGKVIIFYSLTPEGLLDPYSLHGACPVEDGVKWAANKWIWNKPTGFY